MNTIIAEHARECKFNPIDRLRQLLAELPDAEQATIWEGVALTLAARQHGVEE